MYSNNTLTLTSSWWTLHLLEGLGAPCVVTPLAAPLRLQSPKPSAPSLRYLRNQGDTFIAMCNFFLFNYMLNAHNLYGYAAMACTLSRFLFHKVFKKPMYYAYGSALSPGVSKVFVFIMIIKYHAHTDPWIQPWLHAHIGREDLFNP